MTAIADTHLEGGDAQQAPFMGSGGAVGNRPQVLDLPAIIRSHLMSEVTAEMIEAGIASHRATYADNSGSDAHLSLRVRLIYLAMEAAKPSPVARNVGLSDENERLREAAQIARDFATAADAEFLAWRSRAEQGTDTLSMSGACALGMAHQARRIAESIEACLTAVEGI